MNWWVYATNIVVGGVAWALTRFGIPFVNRELHTNIPDGPATKDELMDFIKTIVEAEIEAHVKCWHTGVVPPVAMPAPVTNLGPNPFSSTPNPIIDQANPLENGAK